MQKKIILRDESQTLQLGERLGRVLGPGDILFLQGDLGVGKTTLARGLLRSLGYSQPIKSPTYTIVESYLQGDQVVYHFDLYRIHDPEELMDIGLTDYLTDEALLIIEWPEKAQVLLPQPTLICTLKHAQAGREAELTAMTEHSINCLSSM